MAPASRARGARTSECTFDLTTLGVSPILRLSRDFDRVHWVISVRAYRLRRDRGVPLQGRRVPAQVPARPWRAGGATCRAIDPGVTCERAAARARLAARIDRELRAACRTETAVRRELGEVARALIARRGYQRFGFVRLADYARERLGVSARTLESAAWLATRLEALPLVAAAFDRSEITWTQARALARVAGMHEQHTWLARARTLTAVELHHLARTKGAVPGSPLEPDEEDDEIDGEPTARVRVPCPARLRALWRRAVELASRVAGESLPAWRAAEIIAAEAFAGRPARASFGDRMLLVATRLARRMRQLHVGVSETSIARRVEPPPASNQPSSPAMPGDAPTPGDAATLGDAPMPGDARPTSSARAALPHGAKPLAPGVGVDPFTLDARLLDAIMVLRTSEPKIGRLLRLLVDHRFHRALGCRSLDEYVRERLGISTRKAWALLKVERRARPIVPFAKSYEEGVLSWTRALALLPVITRENADSWVARATSVTVRRLVDEVNWVLDRRDVLGPDVPLDPPPAGSRLVPMLAAVPDEAAPDGMVVAPVQPDAPASLRSAAACTAAATRAATAMCACQKTALARRLQIGAPVTLGEALVPAVCECHKTSLASDGRRESPEVPPAAEVCDTAIALTVPLSVMALFQDTLDAYAREGQPRWTACERMLRHVIAAWERLPRHRDPVFARDGWRCTVPGCSSRRNLHDHHVNFRSRGGGNGLENRTTICAAHHLHGVHDQTVRVSGTAPDGLAWDLGIRSDAPPLLRYIGDTLHSGGRDV